MEKMLVIKCEENKDFDYYCDNEACNEDFLIDERKIYVKESINYFSEPVKYYYTVCPNCGHLVYIDENNLTEEDKIMAELRSEEFYIHEKNRLRGRLIHIDYLEEKDKERKKKLVHTL